MCDGPSPRVGNFTPGDAGALDHCRMHVVKGYFMEGIRETQSKPSRAAPAAARCEAGGL